MVMCRYQQDQPPRRIDGANRESPDRLAHVLLMGSGKWSKSSHVVDGGVDRQTGKITQDTQDTMVVAEGGASGLSPLEALPRGNERRQTEKRKAPAPEPRSNADQMPLKVDRPS